MGWSEVFKINSNLKKPLNKQIQDMKFQPVRVITATGTYTPEKTGLYKIICVGAGGNGYCGNSSYYGGASGGGGGVAIKTMTLSSSTNYSVTVNTGTASFAYSGGAITALPGGTPTSIYITPDAIGVGGTASGGDYNFTGEDGSYTGKNIADIAPRPGSVGVFISDLSKPSYVVGHTFSSSYTGVPTIEYQYGGSILGYGGGGTGASYYVSSTNRGSHSKSGQPAAVIIVPMELEE